MTPLWFIYFFFLNYSYQFLAKSRKLQIFVGKYIGHHLSKLSFSESLTVKNCQTATNTTRDQLSSSFVWLSYENLEEWKL